MLPPSINCKNRLHIERDSKTRRILSNFGLTYRNSKWADYVRSNVVFRSIRIFLRLLRGFFKVFIVIGLLLLLLNTGAPNSFFSLFSHMYWSLAEAVWAGVVFGVWFLWTLLTYVVRWVYHKIFTFVLKDFQEPTPTTHVDTNSSGKGIEPKDLGEPKPSQGTNCYSDLWGDAPLMGVDFKKTSLPKYNSLSLFYVSLDPSEYPSLEYVEDSHRLKPAQSEHLKLKTRVLSSLFKYTHMLTLENKCWNWITSFISWFLDKIELVMSVYSKSDTTVDHNYTAPKESEFWNQEVLNSPSLHFLNTRKQYGLEAILNETNHWDPEVKQQIRAHFYVEGRDASHLTNSQAQTIESMKLLSDINTRKSAVNWIKWAYKHNLLHSHMLKNSHKLTLTKQLLTGGYYDSTTFSNNIWAANEFNKNIDQAALYSSYSEFYKPSQNKTLNGAPVYNTETAPVIKGSFIKLRYFEPSFFWFVRRFYLYHPLTSYSWTSVPTASLKTTNLSTEINTTIASSNAFTTVLQSSTSTFPNLDLKAFSSINNSTLTGFTDFDDSKTSIYHNKIKDVTLFYKDMDFLSHDNTRSLLNLNGVWGLDLNNVKVFNNNKRN